MATNAPLAGLTTAGKIPPFPGDSKAGKHPFKKAPKALKSRGDLTSALDAHDRVQALSDAIRAAKGLPPLPENGIVEAWREALGSTPAPKRKAAAKCQAALTPEARVRELAKRRREAEREREAIDKETRELVAIAQAGRLSVSGIAKSLGISRQRLYQLASA